MSSVDKVPENRKLGISRYGSGLTLEIAKKMLKAGEKEAIEQGIPMVMTICDAGGNILAFHRTDNASMMSTQIVMDIAYTAVFGKIATWKYSRNFPRKELIHLPSLEHWNTLPGGFPITKNGVVLGGIGVSEGIREGLYLVKAALEAGGYNLDEVNESLNVLQSSEIRRSSRVEDQKTGLSSG
jgi:uncharacterized protein GlcG (DUF336 family)